MEINLLVISIGNTRLAMGVFVSGELQHTARFNVDQKELIAAHLSEAWQRISDLGQSAVAGASVQPKIAAIVDEQVLRVTGQKTQWVGTELDLPIKVLTEHPQKTGVDRIVNIAAAFEQLQKACVVVDAGTAITVDCCNDQGEMVGGAIAPGVGAALGALHTHAANLPRVSFREPTGTFGTNTEQAILQGVFYGARGLVRELVERYATDLGFWPDVIATGGDAPVLFEGWELVHAVAPDLTLYGIALAFTNHYVQHDE